MTNILKTQHAKPASFETVVDEIFRNNLNKLFDDDIWPVNSMRNPNQAPVNVQETDAGYELQLIAPGLRKEDFELNLTGELLTISYTKSADRKSENKNKGFLRQEYRLESFVRSFTCDDSVDATKVSARYENGILYLSLPKKEGAHPVSKSITVQ